MNTTCWTSLACGSLRAPLAARFGCYSGVTYAEVIPPSTRKVAPFT
jgi:hypothetical protein